MPSAHATHLLHCNTVWLHPAAAGGEVGGAEGGGGAAGGGGGGAIGGGDEKPNSMKIRTRASLLLGTDTPFPSYPWINARVEQNIAAPA